MSPVSSWWGEDLLYGPAGDGLWACGAVPVTYGRMRDEVAWHRRVLRGQGIGHGSTVAMLGHASFTQLWSLFALWSLGAQPMLLAPRITPAERTAVLDALRPQFAMTFGGGYHRVRTFSDECEVLVRRLAGGRPAATSHCVVQMSSGTSGHGKAIGRTPDSLLAELERLAVLAGMPGPGEPVLLLDSWAYSFGLIGGVLHATRHGAPLVLPLSADPRTMTTRVPARVVIGAPRHYEALVGAATTAFAGLRRAVSTGELLHQSVHEGFARRYGVRIGQAYGMTETGAIAADLSGAIAPPHVGTTLPGVRTRIVDGVLHVHLGQSPYVLDPGAWRGGWLSTNDLMSISPETGALRLRGRLSGVESPTYSHVDLVEVERVLRAYQNVTEAVVVGSDVIDALVVGDGLTGDELEAWCRRALVGGHPPVRCTVVGALARTPNGKYVRSRQAVCEAGAARVAR